MIGVEVTESHPFFLGHMAEVGMTRRTRVWRIAGEAVEEVSEFGDVAVKVVRRGGFILLVDFAQRLESFGPGGWHPEAAPLEDSTRIRKTGRGNHD